MLLEKQMRSGTKGDRIWVGRLLRRCGCVACGDYDSGGMSESERERDK